MANFAYLRVSTNKQYIENQKLSVLDYCNHHNLVPVKHIEDTSSGKLHWQIRPIQDILENAAKKAVHELKINNLPSPIVSDIEKQHLTITSSRTEVHSKCGQCN